MLMCLGIFHQRNKVLPVYRVMKTHLWQPVKLLKMVLGFLVHAVIPISRGKSPLGVFIASLSPT